ncbi:MAG: 3-deoxy-8-phosphooctulonate synthase [Bryobacteraceae bacterium]
MRIDVAPGVAFGMGPAALIAGPCVIESGEHAIWLAREIAKRAGPFVFKASFDKANRTSLSGYRGPGLREGLRVLAEVRKLGCPVLTDIHEPAQAGPAAEVADILQIPAFLCRQTDLLLEAGRTGKIVNLKKGQFVAPHDFRHAADKVASTGNSRLMLTERGSSFGYNNLVVDMRSLPILRSFGWPVLFDATHSVQLPGGAGAASGGQPEFIEILARAAVAAGIDGLFVEVHEAPERALSDGANALHLQRLEGLWRRLRTLDALVKSPEFLHAEASPAVIT